MSLYFRWWLFLRSSRTLNSQDVVRKRSHKTVSSLNTFASSAKNPNGRIKHHTNHSSVIFISLPLRLPLMLAIACIWILTLEVQLIYSGFRFFLIQFFSFSVARLLTLRIESYPSRWCLVTSSKVDSPLWLFFFHFHPPPKYLPQFK